jgi:hypothetical protein
MGNAPTGNQASVTGILIDRISGGKIEEEWVDYDTFHLMQQIGGVPQPGRGRRSLKFRCSVAVLPLLLGQLGYPI